MNHNVNHHNYNNIIYKLRSTINNPNPVPFIRIKLESIENETSLKDSNCFSLQETKTSSVANSLQQTIYINNEALAPVEASDSLKKILKDLTEQNEHLKKENKAAEETIFELKASLYKANDAQISDKVDNFKYLFETTLTLSKRLENLSNKFVVLTKENEQLRLDNNKKSETIITDLRKSLSEANKNLVEQKDACAKLQLEKQALTAELSNLRLKKEKLFSKNDAQDNQEQISSMKRGSPTTLPITKKVKYADENSENLPIKNSNEQKYQIDKFNQNYLCDKSNLISNNINTVIHKEDRHYIQLRIMSQDKTEYRFQVKFSAKLGKLTKMYSDLRGVPLWTLRFFYNNTRILDIDTPKYLKMNESDIIEVIQDRF